MAASLLDRTLLERVSDKLVEMCGPLAFISWLSHLVHSGQAPGQGAVVGSLRIVCSISVSIHLMFSPSNKFINVWACTCTRYEK